MLMAKLNTDKHKDITLAQVHNFIKTFLQRFKDKKEVKMYFSIIKDTKAVKNHKLCHPLTLDLSIDLNRRN